MHKTAHCTRQLAPCRDIKATRILSRHPIGVTTPLRPLQVVTSKWGRDINSQQARSRSQFHVATSFPSYLCRDIDFMSQPHFCHSGNSRSRRRNPCRDLPYCHPCRDIKSMSRHCFCPTKADQVATSLPCHELLETNPRRDINFMSRPLTLFPRSQHEFHVATKDPSFLTSARSRHQRMLRHQPFQFMLKQKKFIFIFPNHPAAFLHATPDDAVA